MLTLGPKVREMLEAQLMNLRPRVLEILKQSHCLRCPAKTSFVRTHPLITVWLHIACDHATYTFLRVVRIHVCIMLCRILMWACSLHVLVYRDAGNLARSFVSYIHTHLSRVSLCLHIASSCVLRACIAAHSAKCDRLDSATANVDDLDVRAAQTHRMRIAIQ